MRVWQVWGGDWDGDWILATYSTEELAKADAAIREKEGAYIHVEFADVLDALAIVEDQKGRAAD